MSKRSNKIANLIKVEISNMLLFGELKDPRLKEIVITNVKVTDDIGKATIFFNKGVESELDKIMAGFKNATGFIRKTLAKKLYLKRVPNLFFIYDEQLDQMEKIENLLKKAKNG